jgi:hypothetical protein
MLGCRRHPDDPSRDDSRCPAAQDQDHSTTTSRADEVVWRRRPRRERLQTGGAVRWKRLLNLEAKDHHTGTVDADHAQAGERRACPEERPEQPRPARGSPSEGVSRQAAASVAGTTTRQQRGDAQDSPHIQHPHTPHPITGTSSTSARVNSAKSIISPRPLGIVRTDASGRSRALRVGEPSPQEVEWRREVHGARFPRTKASS